MLVLRSLVSCWHRLSNEITRGEQGAPLHQCILYHWYACVLFVLYVPIELYCHLCICHVDNKSKIPAHVMLQLVRYSYLFAHWSYTVWNLRPNVLQTFLSEREPFSTCRYRCSLSKWNIIYESSSSLVNHHNYRFSATSKNRKLWNAAINGTFHHHQS